MKKLPGVGDVVEAFEEELGMMTGVVARIRNSSAVITKVGGDGFIMFGEPGELFEVIGHQDDTSKEDRFITQFLDDVGI